MAISSTIPASNTSDGKNFSLRGAKVNQRTSSTDHTRFQKYKDGSSKVFISQSKGGQFEFYKYFLP